MFLYYNWLVEQLSKNMPMDEMVRELLGASGGTFKNPATNFYQGTKETLALTENVAQVFMGMRIQCAQCHNHPFDRWTQDDYYGFAAFFAQIGRKQGEDYRETIIFNSGGGEVTHPVGGRAMPPKFLGGDAAETPARTVASSWRSGSPRRKNPWFASSFANRVWAHFTGLGIVEPVDDFRVSNPASNPELLAELAKRSPSRSTTSRRSCATSATRGRISARPHRNATNDRTSGTSPTPTCDGSRPRTCSTSSAKSPRRRTSSRACPSGPAPCRSPTAASRTYFLTTFGRATRETVCSCEVKMEPTLSQALHLLNGDTVNAKIQQGGRRELIDAKSSRGAITDLYLRCLSRKPTQPRTRQALAQLRPGANPAQALEDVFWALLNSREFLFNH